MALTTPSNRVVATGDGATTVFPFNRLLYDATHLQVYLGTTLQVSGYTVSGVPGSSTSVTFSVAPTNGTQVILLRVVPITQLSVYNVGGAFPAATTEKNFDLTVMGLQQFDETLDRAVTLPVTSPLTTTTFPDPANPANYGRGVKIKGDGTGLDVFDILPGATSGIVTTKGDLHTRSASAEDRLPVGANNTVLVANSAAGLGINWSASLAGLTIVSPTLSGTPIVSGIPSLTGGGLAFPAAQVPSADANTLDDYEEGTWTLSLGGSATYTTRVGRYTKIGRAVFVYGEMAVNVLGTGSTSQVTGLPFNAVGDCPLAIGYITTLADTIVSATAYVANGSGAIQFRSRLADSATDAVNAIFGNGSAFIVSGVYYV